MNIKGGLEWEKTEFGNGEVLWIAEGRDKSYSVYQGPRLASVVVVHGDGEEELIGSFLNAAVAKDWCEKEEG